MITHTRWAVRIGDRWALSKVSNRHRKFYHTACAFEFAKVFKYVEDAEAMADLCQGEVVPITVGIQDSQPTSGS